MSSNLSLCELRKRPYRIDIFLEKIWKSDPFVTQDSRLFLVESLEIDGSTFFYVNKTDNLKAKEKILNCPSGTSILVTGIYTDESSYKTLRTSDFIKNSEFGGQGPYEMHPVEFRQLSRINSQITSPITISYKDLAYHDISLSKKTNDKKAKSDFEFVDSLGNSKIWISHKQETFNGWSGVTQFTNNSMIVSNLFQNWILNFVEEVREANNINKSRKAYARRIPSQYSKDYCKAIYGKNYGSMTYGQDNVHMVCVGDITLKSPQNNGIYEITAPYIFYNGDTQFEKYEPIITAIYKGDRSNFDIEGYRFDFYPIVGGGRNINNWIFI